MFINDIYIYFFAMILSLSNKNKASSITFTVKRVEKKYIFFD
jgi:hypothetical protein